MATTMETVDSKQVWNPFDPLSKPNLLRVVRNEADGFFTLAEPRENWERGTAAGHWQVRDVVGHIVDVTEAYLDRFAGAREGRKVAPVCAERR